MSNNFLSLQFERFDSKTSFLEVCECFEIDKIRMGFRTFDQKRQKGDRILTSIDIFMSIRDANELAYQIQSNRLAKKRAAMLELPESSADRKKPLYKSKIGGNKTESGVRYREFSIFTGSKAEYAIGANSGPGKQDEKGLIQIDGKPDKKVFVPLSEEDMRALAGALKRAISTYDTLRAMDFFKKKSAENRHNGS